MKKLFTLVLGMVMAVCAYGQSTTNIWTGEQTFDESWSGSFTVDKAKFATAKEGDKLILTCEPVTPVEWEWGSQVFIKTSRAGWGAIASTVNVASAGTYEVMIKDDELTVEDKTDATAPAKVTTTMLKELQEYGLVVQGIDSKVTRVNLYSAVASDKKELTLLAGNKLAASEFDKYADDVQVAVVIENVSDPYASRNGWGIGEILTIDDYTKDEYTILLTGQDGTSFEFYTTVGALKKVAKKGTDEYIVSKYNQTGVVFNVYNACKVKSVYVIVPKGTSGISSTFITEAKKADAPRYNMAGQMVGKSYKGVVIQNGRKYMQN